MLACVGEPGRQGCPGPRSSEEARKAAAPSRGDGGGGGGNNGGVRSAHAVPITPAGPQVAAGPMQAGHCAAHDNPSTTQRPDCPTRGAAGAGARIVAQCRAPPCALQAPLERQSAPLLRAQRCGVPRLGRFRRSSRVCSGPGGREAPCCHRRRCRRCNLAHPCRLPHRSPCIALCAGARQPGSPCTQRCDHCSATAGAAAGSRCAGRCGGGAVGGMRSRPSSGGGPGARARGVPSQLRCVQLLCAKAPQPAAGGARVLAAPPPLPAAAALLPTVHPWRVLAPPLHAPSPRACPGPWPCSGVPRRRAEQHPWGGEAHPETRWFGAL